MLSRIKGRKLWLRNTIGVWNIYKGDWTINRETRSTGKILVDNKDWNRRHTQFSDKDKRSIEIDSFVDSQEEIKRPRLANVQEKI